MTTRTPVNAITNKLLTVTLTDTAYTVPANSVFTVSALMLNNTTSTARTVTANAIPSGQSVNATNEFATAVPVSASGNQPTAISSLVGQHFPAGTTFQFKADAAAAISINLSGYVTA